MDSPDVLVICLNMVSELAGHVAVTAARNTSLMLESVPVSEVMLWAPTCITFARGLAAYVLTSY